MPVKKIGADLEREILGLDPKERNKLLLRLIGKDKILVEQLHFKLLETPEVDIPIREDDIKKQLKDLHQGTFNGRDLFWFYRRAFALVNHHKKITSDKVSEMRLSVQVLYIIVTYYKTILLSDQSVFNDKLNKNFVKKVVSLLKKLNDLHEDYRIEFVDVFNSTLEIIHVSNLKYYVGGASLPKSIE